MLPRRHTCTAWAALLPLSVLAAACSPAVRPGSHGDGGAGDGSRDGSPGYVGPGPRDAGPDAGRVTQVYTCIECPRTPFPDFAAPACASDPAASPTLVYPPDGIMVPPNLGTIEVQFTPGSGNTLWEISFRNDVTDVRVTTRCAPVTSARGRATGVCGAALTPDIFRAFAAPNRGHGTVQVTVRGTTDAQACAASAPNPRALRVAYDDAPGEIYYWQAAVTGAAPRRPGGVYASTFGDAFAPSAPVATSAAPHSCTGCHAVSPDGARAALVYDLSTDTFQDTLTQLIATGSGDVLVGNPGGARCIADAVPPGFQTFNRDHSLMLASYFKSDMLAPAGCGGTNESFVLFDAEAGRRLREVPLPAGVTGTQPDWSLDGRRVVFVKPGTLGRYAVGGASYLIGDHHFTGGDLYAMDVTPPSTFGAARLLLPGTLPGEGATGENANYYPTYAPDADFLAFDHVAAGDVYHNRRARLFLTTSDGQGAVDLARLNGGTDLTDSWPRWASVVTRHDGVRLAWLLFSSTRDYGARLENQAFPNCYPTLSTPDNTPKRSDFTDCARPQIWMAAVALDRAAVASGRDPSYPAFWVPYQPLDAHNHMPRWVSGVPGAACLEPLATCPGAGGADCCSGTTCDPATHACVYACIPRGGRCPGAHGEACCDGLPCDRASGTCTRGPG